MIGLEIKNATTRNEHQNIGRRNKHRDTKRGAYDLQQLEAMECTL